MLYYKIIGSASLLASGFLIYKSRVDYQKKRLDQIDGFIKLISYIKAQIECYMLPINSILDTYPKDAWENIGIHYSASIKTFKDLLDSLNLILDDDIVKLLYDFAMNFGTGYRTDQLHACEQVLIKIMNYRDELKKKNEKDKKVSFAMCMSIMLSLILIMI